VKSFNVMGTKCFGLIMMDMFVDILICGFQIIRIITKANKYFVGILNSWVALPMKNMKLNVQWIKMISRLMIGSSNVDLQHYLHVALVLNYEPFCRSFAEEPSVHWWLWYWDNCCSPVTNPFSPPTEWVRPQQGHTKLGRHRFRLWPLYAGPEEG